MKEFMIQVGTFMLLGKTLLHFCPNEKYEKYLKLLFGFMILIQFISPVLSLNGGNIMDEYIKNQNVFENKFESSLKEVEDKWFIYNEEIEKKIEEGQQKAEEMVQEQEAVAEGGVKEENSGKGNETTENSEEELKNEIEIDKVKIEVSGYE